MPDLKSNANEVRKRFSDMREQKALLPLQKIGCFCLKIGIFGLARLFDALLVGWLWRPGCSYDRASTYFMYYAAVSYAAHVFDNTKVFEH